MSIDPYTQCPCGSGKKLKFCCADLAGEIEKIYRMLDGNQPHAALRHVERTLANNPARVSLLDLKAVIELSLDDLENAKATVDRFLEAHPENASALAVQALLLTKTSGGAAAVMPLQKALADVDHNMPQRVVEAIGTVGHALLVEGYVIAAQAHLWLNAAIAREDDTRALELLIGLNQNAGLPLLLREKLQLKPCPDDVPWRDEALGALELADHGRWYEATRIIDRLGQQYGPDPSLLYNRAVLGGWLGDQRALVAGLHAYARLDVPRDDAVEAEAIAQLLDPAINDPVAGSFKLTYDVRDLEDLERHLFESKEVEEYDVNLDEMASNSEGPPPRHSYLLLDRASPASGAAITRDEVPAVMGLISIYGRQTDRAERLELVVDKNGNFDNAVAALARIGEPALGERSGEELIGDTTEVEMALGWRWHFPPDTPPPLRQALLAAERHEAIVSRWPDVPRAVLGGKTPREAASDPELTIPLEALVLILAQGSNNTDQADSIAELRRELSLPEPEPLDSKDISQAHLPLARANRMDLSQFEDEELVQFYRRAVIANATVAIRAACTEAIRRPSLSERIPTSEVYSRLIDSESDSTKALELIAEARHWSEQNGESMAAWDLAELDIHISNANFEDTKRMLTEIDARHGNNPDVLVATYRLLADAGLVKPDDVSGQPTIPDSPKEMPGTARPVAEESRIWTPGDEAAAAPGQKSKLWTPS